MKLFRKKKDELHTYYFRFEHSNKFIKIHGSFTQDEAKAVADDINNDPSRVLQLPFAELVNNRYC